MQNATAGTQRGRSRAPPLRTARQSCRGRAYPARSLPVISRFPIHLPHTKIPPPFQRGGGCFIYSFVEISVPKYFSLNSFSVPSARISSMAVSMAARKGDETATLLEAINSAIEELRADGTLSELGEKYFGQDISSEN